MDYKDNIRNIGNVFIHKPQLPSTNKYAKHLITSNTKPTEGTVIFTDYQTAGIGQHDSSWYTEVNKAVTMSVILYPDFLPPDRHYYLTIIAALAVYESCKKYINKGNLSIKWPNDLLINNCKLCGILIQTTLGNNKIKSAVVGIGVNLTPYDVNPSELPAIAFLENYTEESVISLAFANKISAQLQSFYNILAKNNYATLKNLYYRVMYKKDELFTYYDKAMQEKKHGIIRGIDKKGNLQVEINSEIHSYPHKSIQYIR